MSKKLILLFFLPFALFSQDSDKKYYGIAEIPIKPKTAFRFDKLSYTIVDVVDMQDNNSTLGEVYIGMLNHFVRWHVKDGVSESFMKYFDKSLRRVETGDREIVVAFQKYSMNEKEENLGLRGGRLRNYEIVVDYYESKDNELEYLYTDSKKVDSLSNQSTYNINKFTDGFFKSSLLGLDKYLRENPSNENDTLVEDVLLVEQTKNSNSISNSYDTLSPKLQPNYVKKEPKGIPDTHLNITFESFSGLNAYGYRFRYFGFQRDWDSLKWVGVFSLDVEATGLNKDFYNKNKIYLVEYSYFALGLGTIKPLNNYFFLEFSLKLAIGTERIAFDPFYEHKRKNTLFGTQLNQRIHFILGKGFGLTLSAGIYENFYPTTDYLKSDIGYSIGGGIKF